MKPLTYFLTLLLATFFMGSSFIVSKLLLRDLAPFWLAGWRFVIAAISTVPIVILMGRNAHETTGKRPKWGVVAVIGVVQTTGVMALLFLSMQTISAANAAILLFTNPIWVAAASHFLPGERLTKWQVISLLAGLAGVILAMGIREAGTDMRGNLLGLGSAFCWSAGTLISKFTKSGMHPLRLNMWQMGIGGLLLLGLSFASGEAHTLPGNTPQWSWFLWLAVPSSVGSYGLWFLALQRGGAARSSSFLFLAPLFATGLSVLTLGTTLTGWQWLGGGLVGLSIYGMNRQPGARSIAT